MATLKEYRDMMFYARAIAALYRTALAGAAMTFACQYREHTAGRRQPPRAPRPVARSGVCGTAGRTARD
jgi:hypothetical protein